MEYMYFVLGQNDWILNYLFIHCLLIAYVWVSINIIIGEGKAMFRIDKVPTPMKLTF